MLAALALRLGHPMRVPHTAAPPFSSLWWLVTPIVLVALAMLIPALRLKLPLMVRLLVGSILLAPSVCALSVELTAQDILPTGGPGIEIRVSLLIALLALSSLISHIGASHTSKDY
ncbi:hypothetical protein OG455_14335 [Kitasatospora sp. NBC_01287]|uniref:hypothetical protein n=1 Tax=Kitasatospora sp. NBC_01287 TaxID=2903573 RepID=UPI00224CF48A|nr:hypothetical protein [Kitasatospora sp. NBC_01287]MCX4746682.1 hypothetical protein [Kitasatospora sp. NBC_01287]